MSLINHIQVGDSTYEMRNIFYVKGTQTATTGTWTGELPEVDALYDGLIIAYWLPYAGSGNATLNLTLSDGSTTGAIPCYYYSTNRLTTHVNANSFAYLVYQTVTISSTSYTGWWLAGKSVDNNTTDICNLFQGNGKYTADSVIYRYQLLFQIDDDTITPLNNNSNTTDTSKTMLTDVTFDPFGHIFYHNSTSTISASGTASTSLYYYRQAIDLRYTFNCGTTLTANQYIYLVLSLQSDGSVKIASDLPLSQTLPSSNDGYLYLLLGRTYSTYQMTLFSEHPIYYHDGTELRKYENIDISVTTDTVGSASAGTAISADEITAWDAGTLPSASVSGEVLTLDFGSLPSLTYTTQTIPNITVTSKTVVTAVE